MKIPYFEEKWKDAPRKDKQTIRRKNIFVILKHSEKEEFCLLDWTRFWWKSFIVWGIDEGESYINAWKRETIEETWYNDFWKTEVLDFEFNNNFFAKHKDINRYSIEKYVFIELISMKNIWVKLEEVENHDFVWVKKEEIENFINLDNNKYAWRLFNIWKNIDEKYLKGLKNFKWYK